MVDVIGGEDRMHHHRANYDALADLSALILLGTSHKIDRCLTRRLFAIRTIRCTHAMLTIFIRGYDEGDNVPGDRLIREFTKRGKDIIAFYRQDNCARVMIFIQENC